jgi:glycosyltransferase involved in cell wall biosynthesis
MLSLLKNNHDITILSDNPFDDLRFIKLLSDIDNIITYKDFERSWVNTHKKVDNRLEVCMKYIITQLISELYRFNYDYVVLLNGIYECHWYTPLIKDAIDNMNPKTNVKLLVWVPLDYIPCPKLCLGIGRADILVTMNYTVAKILGSTLQREIHVLEHGSDIIKDINNTSDTILNNIISQIPSNPQINQNDIIILNANNYVPRKQIYLTLLAFIALVQKHKDIKLWIHTNLKSLKNDVNTSIMPIINKYRDRIILSNNNIIDLQLVEIYKRCQYSLQTSSGEGFSLTNIEHALLGGIQIVPNFLATGYHFKNGRGILIPTKNTLSKSENDLDILVGGMTLDDIIKSLDKALMLDEDSKNNIRNSAKEYASSLTWESIAQKFNDILRQ